MEEMERTERGEVIAEWYLAKLIAFSPLPLPSVGLTFVYRQLKTGSVSVKQKRTMK